MTSYAAPGTIGGMVQEPGSFDRGGQYYVDPVTGDPEPDDPPGVHLTLEYDPLPPDPWEGVTYADFQNAQDEAEAAGTLTTTQATAPAPAVNVAGVQVPAMLAWGLGLAALYFILDRSF